MLVKSASNIEGLYPLIPLQKGLLFHSLYSPGSGVYGQQLRMTILGPLDTTLRTAWEKIVERHSSLRTCFIWESQEQPLQVVKRRVKLPYQDLDWRPVAADEQNEKLEAFLKADRTRGFDFTRAPLLRITRIRMADEVTELVATSHHIILDGWSNFIIVQELIRELVQDPTAEPATKPVAYRDYIEWTQAQNPASAESYWRNSLRGISEPTRIPDMEPGDFHGHNTGQRSCQLRLAPQVRIEAQQFAHSCGVTLNTLLAGAWALLLSCCNNREDVSFGLTVSGRPAELPGVEDMVGLFINTLPLPAKIDNSAELVSWLQHLQSQILELQDHASSDLLDVQKWSQMVPGQPLFESIFVFESQSVTRRSATAAGKLSFLNIHSVDSGSFPLALIVAVQDEIRLGISYDSSRIAEASVKRLLERYSTVIDRMRASASQRLWEILALSPLEHTALLTGSRETGRDFGFPICLHELFEKQALASPEMVAVSLGEERWTYRQLNQRANRLAARLRRHGAGPEHRVGIHLESPADTVVAILAVLKSGGAYVPLDTAYPQQVLNHMVLDSGLKVIVTDKKLGANLPPGAVHLDVSIEQKETEAESTDNYAACLSPDNLAYVIYTSGSTGLPKGVAVTHRNAFNTVQWFNHTFLMDSSQRTLLSVSTCFDPSVIQIFSALASGAELICMKPGAKDAAYILDIIKARRVTLMDFPPSVLGLLLSETRPEQFASVKQVLAGGEAVLPSLLTRLFSQIAAPFSNLYGPTETCVNASCWTCASDSVALRVTIGRPITNARLYILDRCLQPVPAGVSGEIFIGGAGVSRGYLNRPDLTAEKFVPDPFGEIPSARLYRTGDLARFLYDGNVEFIGRSDTQVKIRGLRIECGQVEAAIKQHSAVHEAVAVVRQNRDDEPLLVAYVAVKHPLTTRELNAFLKGVLPGYMIPSILVLMDEIPALPNGKIDRNALPPVDLESSVRTQTTPRNEWEGLLATIWANVLKRDSVGINDNFFALGGHSLTAIRVASKVQEAFGIEFPVRLLFEKPTIVELCGELQELVEGAEASKSTPLSARDALGRAPMSFAQQRLWFLDRLAPGEPFYNIPEAFRLRGSLDLLALEAALAEILRRHSVLRTTFAEDGELLQLIRDDVNCELQSIDLTALRPEKRELEARGCAEREARSPFDLEQGPLVRSQLLTLTDEDHILLLTFHHIIADGWSVNIVGQELFGLYRAFHERLPSALPELPIQYADFAIWQRERLAGAVLDQKLDYWKKQLAGASGVLELPTDLPRPASQGFHGASCAFEVPMETARLLKRLGLQESATSFMVLLAAFSSLLHRYSGQTDVLVGSPVSGRDRPELEGLVGLFVNTIVLRTNFSDEPTFRELLKRVRSTTVAAYSNQELPFEKIIEELNPARDLSRSPLFQVMFSFQQAETKPERSYGGLEVSSFGTNAGTSKFDLELLITESVTGFEGTLEYNTDLFLPDTITAMVSHFRNLLKGIAIDPQSPVSRLPFLDESERREIVQRFSPGPRRPLPQLCFSQIFESQSGRSPDRPAVSADDGSFTYGELNERANSVAHSLLAEGLRREGIVATLSDRGAFLLSSMLAIWKAGGVYLPLDAKYPAKRLAEMLKQAHAELVIVTPEWKDLLNKVIAEMPSGRTVRVMDSNTLLANPAKHNPAPRCVPDGLAYVIFTSGSTGTPKGAMVEHKGTLNHLLAKVEDLELKSEDVVAQTASQCFDISIWQFLAALVVGGRTHVWPDTIAHNPALLLEEIDNAGVSVLEVVPSLLRLIVDEVVRAPRHFPLRALRWLVPTGESLPPKLARSWLEHYPHIPIVNAYGPTECSDDVTHCHVYAAPDESTTSTPIGKPIRNMSLYVLDEHMQLVPLGVPGELFISGIGVGRGYIYNPEATAVSFCPNPFSADRDRRLYRTGDRARFLRDGKLDFIGRVDHQVKVRGFRIELGETESRLRQHPAVRDCVVIDAKDADHNTQLVAYIVLDSQQDTAAEDFRKFLQARVPEYLVPSLIIVLDALPLTPSGKLDRKALPKPELGLVSRPLFVEPGTEIERRLVHIWEDVLHVNAVGIDDNFFDLGGHSILALRLMAKLQSKFGRKLPLTTLFHHGTIRGLASILEDTFSQSSSPLIAMQSSGSNPPIFFVHVGSGEIVCYVDLVRRLGNNQPFYGLQDPNLYSDSVTTMSIEERAALYIEAVRSVQPRGPYFLGGWSFGGLVAFEMARQFRGMGESVGLLALLDTGSPEFVRQMAGPGDDASLLGIIARELNLSVSDAELRPLALDMKLEFLSARMKDTGFQWIDSVQFLARQLAIFKSRNQVIQDYYPSPYEGPITFFRADQEYVEDATLRPEIARDPTRGFSRLTAHPIEIHIVPGKHHQIAHEPGVQALADSLSACMQKALVANDLPAEETRSHKVGTSV